MKMESVIRETKELCKTFAERKRIPLDQIEGLFRWNSKYLCYSDDLKSVIRRTIWTVRRNQIKKELTRIVAIFQKAGVPVLCLKGLFLEELLYGEVPGRTSSDIDLLIPMECTEKAIRILLQDGYKGGDNQPEGIIGSNRDPYPNWLAGGMHHACEMIKKPSFDSEAVVIELHIYPWVDNWEMNGTNCYDEKLFKKLYDRRIWSESLKAYGLSIEDQWISLILHMVTNHVVLPGIRFSYGYPYIESLEYPVYLLIDFLTLYYRYGENMDWSYINAFFDDRLLYRLSKAWVYRELVELGLPQRLYVEDELRSEKENTRAVQFLALLSEVSLKTWMMHPMNEEITSHLMQILSSDIHGGTVQVVNNNNQCTIIRIVAPNKGNSNVLIFYGQYDFGCCLEWYIPFTKDKKPVINIMDRVYAQAEDYREALCEYRWIEEDEIEVTISSEIWSNTSAIDLIFAEDPDGYKENNIYKPKLWMSKRSVEKCFY